MNKNKKIAWDALTGTTEQQDAAKQKAWDVLRSAVELAQEHNLVIFGTVVPVYTGGQRVFLMCGSYEADCFVGLNDLLDSSSTAADIAKISFGEYITEIARKRREAPGRSWKR